MAVTSYLVISTGSKENSEFCFPLGQLWSGLLYISQLKNRTKYEILGVFKTSRRVDE